MSRFENLDPAVFGENVRVATNFDPSDGHAHVVGTRVGPAGETRIVEYRLDNPGGPGATLETPTQLIGENDDILHNLILPNMTQRAPALARQPYREVFDDETGYENGIRHDNWRIQGSVVEADGYIQVVHPATYATLVTPIPVVGMYVAEIDGDLDTIVSTVNGGYNHQVIGDFIDEDGNQQGDLDFFNPSLAVNEYGVAVLSFNHSGFVEDTVAISRNLYAGSSVSVGIITNGVEARRTQFETGFPSGLRNIQVQDGIANYDIEFQPPWQISGSGIRIDPENINHFVTGRPGANTEDRWFNHIATFHPDDILTDNLLRAPLVNGDAGNNTFVISVSPDNPDLMRIVVDGVHMDELPYEVLDKVRLMGRGGADRFIIDYTHGDPLANAQLIMDGGDGPDVVQSNNPNSDQFVVRPFLNSDPIQVFPNDPDIGEGTLNGDNWFMNVEELWGGEGDDHFLVTQLYPFDPDDPRNPRDPGAILGSLLGRGGDDTFEFEHDGWIGDSVNGGPGYNTLVFQNRARNVDMELTGYGGNQGYNGRTLGNYGQGPIGGDQIEDQFRDISKIIGTNVVYTNQFGGLVDLYDTLLGLDEQATVTIDNPTTTYVTNGVPLELEMVDEVSLSESFADTTNAIANEMDAITINSLGGDDIFNFSSDAPTNMGLIDNLNGLIVANAGTGENLLNVSNIAGTALDTLIVAARISGMGEIVYTADGGNFHLNVWGSNDADIFKLHSFLPDNTLNVYSLNGNDSFDLQDLSKAHVDLFGGEGDDVYTIQRITGVSFRNLEIYDSIDAERDRVTLAGTLLDEVFIIDDTTFDDIEVVYEGIELFGIEGREGNDTFHIRSSMLNLYVDGGLGNDVFNISSDADVNNGSLAGFGGEIVVEGGAGNNQLNISYEADGAKNVIITRDQMLGLVAGPITYMSTTGSFAGNLLTEGIVIEGSHTGDDWFDIRGLDAQHTMRIETFEGSDTFIARGAVDGDLVLDGGDHIDNYRTFFKGAGDREILIRDRSDEENSVVSYMSPNGDVVTVSQFEVRVGGEYVFFNTDLSYLALVGLGGDDSFNIMDSPSPVLDVFGTDGNDIMEVNGTASANVVRLSGQAGNDTMILNNVSDTTYTPLVGGDGNDTFEVNVGALGNVFMNGNDGDDTYDVDFIGGGSNRWTGAFDSGANGNDTLIANGTSAADTINFLNGNIVYGNEVAGFNTNVEMVQANGGLGDDTLNMYASHAHTSYLLGGGGADSLNIFSTANALNVTAMGGDGNDDILVKSTAAMTAVTLDGGNDDDLISIGAKEADNNGLLGRIRGLISVHGGDDNTMDRLYVNDYVSAAPYSYIINNNKLRPIPGPWNLPRPEFAGIDFENDIEHFELVGTFQANHFAVQSHRNTEFLIDGSDPTSTPGDSIQLLDKPGDGHVLTITDAAAGNGFWTFGNSDERIYFENMESWFNPPNRIIWNGGGDDGDGDDDRSDDRNPRRPSFISTASNPDDLMANELEIFEVKEKDQVEFRLMERKEFVSIDEVFESIL